MRGLLPGRRVGHQSGLSPPARPPIVRLAPRAGTAAGHVGLGRWNPGPVGGQPPPAPRTRRPPGRSPLAPPGVLARAQRLVHRRPPPPALPAVRPGGPAAAAG